MTFEATDTRAPETATEETISLAPRPRRITLPKETDLDKLMKFVDNSVLIAGNIRGLAALFRSHFLDNADDLSDKYGYAAEIVEDCMMSFVERLDRNAELAHEVKRSLEKGGAR